MFQYIENGPIVITEFNIEIST